MSVVEVLADRARRPRRSRPGRGSAAASAGAPGGRRRAASPSVASAGIDASRERAELADEAVQVGRRGAQVGQHRRELVGEHARGRPASAAARAGRPAAARIVRSMSALRSAVAWAVSLALLMKLDTRSRRVGQRREHGVGVGCQVGERAVLVGQDRQHLVGLAQRRVGAVDRLVQLARRGRRGRCRTR